MAQLRKKQELYKEYGGRFSLCLRASNWEFESHQKKNCAFAAIHLPYWKFDVKSRVKN